MHSIANRTAVALATALALAAAAASHGGTSLARDLAEPTPGAAAVKYPRVVRGAGDIQRKDDFLYAEPHPAD